jgi:nicotinamidase-related amidase
MNDALLVVDVIDTFEHESGDALLASFRARATQMTETLGMARRSTDLPVMYVNDAHADWAGDAPSFVRRAVDDGLGGDIVSALAPREGERFLFKARYSAFDHTPLALVLQSQQIERILLMGAATEGCVVQTAIDARECGLKATILTNACATADEELERVALAYAEQVGGVRLAPSIGEAVRNGDSGNSVSAPSARESTSFTSS